MMGLGEDQGGLRRKGMGQGYRGRGGGIGVHVMNSLNQTLIVSSHRWAWLGRAEGYWWDIGRVYGRGIWEG